MFMSQAPTLHAPSLLGDSLEISVSGNAMIENTIFVRPEGSNAIAMVVTPDLRSCAGTVHIMTQLLIPTIVLNTLPALE